ncbi:MAG: GDP dissociation inhibitor-domain-containing protein [Benniella sp.]|nr:MAG: GDP dissociation inhibitor-domain-containing protein [Benniella sp.]
MADTDSLDTTLFDAIILGTGFTQTVIAAALARAGKTVLHLDENDYYGGESGAFAFRDLASWTHNVASTKGETTVLTDENKDKIEFNKLVARAYDHIEVQLYRTSQHGDNVIDLSSVLAGHKGASADERIKAVEDYIANAYNAKEQSKEVKEAIHVIALWATSPSSATAANFKTVSFSQISSLQEFIAKSRKYNFDLSPKLLYSRGPLTNLLISSGIGKYLEFKLLERTAVYEASADKIEMMPTSKEDVFVTKALSLKEKRLLMKFLQFAVDYENQKPVWEDYKDAPFVQFVQSAFGLKDKVLTAVVYAIGFDGNDEATTIEGLMAVKLYLQSLGRYGNSAHLCPLYGVGTELAQAFCRVSAVYGGIYMLQHELDKHNVDQEANLWKSVVDRSGLTLQAKQVICTREYLSNDMDAYIEARTLNRSYVSHCILVTDRSAFGETTLCKTLFPKESLILNPGEPNVRRNEHTISVLQLCGGTMSCPSDKFILYVWAESDSPNETAKEELTAAIRKLVHIPGDPLSLKSPTTQLASKQTATSTSKASPTGTESARTHSLGEAPASGGDQPRMSFDQELDMDKVRAEILEAEKRLFEESETSTPQPPQSSSSSKPASKIFQKAKSVGGLSTVPSEAPQALFSLFYKRTTSWPRVPYPIGSEDLKPLPSNLTVLKPMNHSLDFEASTLEARQIFEELCPGMEFLPPTPEPDDGSSGY